jgi:hypothetical protein
MTSANYKYLLKEDIIMFGFIKKIFGTKEEAPKAECPFKVEVPAPSPVAEQAIQAVVESIAPAPAKKKPTPKKAPAKMTAKKAPAKKAPKK